MKRFLQLHLITPYPPSNLNRDDLGRPKTAVVGGTQRLRISSQCLKRSWRTSEVFQQNLEGHIGLRTKRIGLEAKQMLVERGVEEDRAIELGREIGELYGKLSKSKDGEFFNETVSHVTPEERQAIKALVERLARGGEFDKKSDEILSNDHSAVDVAMFGRMLASTPKFNVEAAVQVAHAITTHVAVVEDDFFTAVDDLKTREEDSGSAHMGETEFGAGVYYLYVCIDRQQLVENLNGDADLGKQGIHALIEAMCTIAPSGKQNSFGSRAYASYVLAELGNRQPRSLSSAFIDPVTKGDHVASSITRLKESRAAMDEVYGPCADTHYELDAKAGTGKLTDALEFCGQELDDA